MKEQVENNADLLINFIKDTIGSVNTEQERLIRELIRAVYQQGYQDGVNS